MLCTNACRVACFLTHSVYNSSSRMSIVEFDACVQAFQQSRILSFVYKHAMQRTRWLHAIVVSAGIERPLCWTALWHDRSTAIVHDVSFPTEARGEWKTGEEKGEWLKVGTVQTCAVGHLSMLRLMLWTTAECLCWARQSTGMCIHIADLDWLQNRRVYPSWKMNRPGQNCNRRPNVLTLKRNYVWRFDRDYICHKLTKMATSHTKTATMIKLLEIIYNTL